MNRIKIVSLISSLLISGMVLAAPVTDQSLEDLFKVTNVEKLVSDSAKMLEQNSSTMLDRMLAQMQVTPDKIEEIKSVASPIVSNMLVKAKEVMQWSNVKPKYVEIYKRTFNQEEVEGMIAFYKTPVGQSVLVKMPKLMQESMMMTQQMMMPMFQGMQQEIQKVMIEKRALTTGSNGANK